MHMWFWWGYDLGEFLFPGLNIGSHWSFALTWIVLFVISLLFEGSKVYLARVQRQAQRTLSPYRCDERRNLLYDRERAGVIGPATSRNGSPDQPSSRWVSLRIRVLVTAHQSLVFVAHNVVGYLLMLAVMMYNVHLMVAVMLGMMLGYFLFGAKLTRLQMQCFATKRVVICTPECDDTAEGTTPPLLNSSVNSESDLFVCQTRTCITPSHYYPSTSQDGASHASTVTCHYGAKKCPSKVARANKTQSTPGPSQAESEKEDSPSIEDVQLLRTERQGCCKKKQEPPPSEARDKTCCKKKTGHDVPTTVVHTDSSCEDEGPSDGTRATDEDSECCRNTSSTSDRQELGLSK